MGKPYWLFFIWMVNLLSLQCAFGRPLEIGYLFHIISTYSQIQQSQTQQGPALNYSVSVSMASQETTGISPETSIQPGCIWVFAFSVWQPGFQNNLGYYSSNKSIPLQNLTASTDPLYRHPPFPLGPEVWNEAAAAEVWGFWWTSLGNLKSEMEVLSVVLECRPSARSRSAGVIRLQYIPVSSSHHS